MRKRINTSIEIINNYQEVSNLIIKGDPLHREHSNKPLSARHGRRNKKLTQDEANDGEV